MSTVGDGELFVFGVLARQRAQQLHQTLVGFSSASDFRRSPRLSLHVQQRGAEGDEDLAVLRDDVVPLPVVLTHHELEVELQGFYVGALRYILLDS